MPENAGAVQAKRDRSRQNPGKCPYTAMKSKAYCVTRARAMGAGIGQCHAHAVLAGNGVFTGSSYGATRGGTEIAGPRQGQAARHPQQRVGDGGGAIGSARARAPPRCAPLTAPVAIIGRGRRLAIPACPPGRCRQHHAGAGGGVTGAERAVKRHRTRRCLAIGIDRGKAGGAQILRQKVGDAEAGPRSG